MSRGRLTGPQLAGMTVGLMAIAMVAFAASSRGCSGARTLSVEPQRDTVVESGTVTADTVAADTAKVRRQRRGRRRVKKAPPQPRSHLDERV